MAYPISGPFSTIVKGGKPPSSSIYDSATRYRTVKPYDRPAPYRREKRLYGPVSVGGTNPEIMKDWEASVSSSHGDCFPLRPSDSRVSGGFDFALNKARAQMIDNIGLNAQLGETLGEWRQTSKLLGNKIGAVYTGLKWLTKGNLASAITSVGGSLKSGFGEVLISKYKGRGAVSISAAASKIWLEMHFGWVPLVQDIYTLTHILTDQQPSGVAKGKYRKTAPWTYASNEGPYGNYRWRGQHIADRRAYCQTGWRIVSPNLFLANRLGLVNPVSIAWNLVPFSFFVDWFVNINQFTNEWSDFLGLETFDSFYTVFYKDTVDSSLDVFYPGSKLYSFNRAKTMSIYTERFLGIPEVHLEIAPLQRLSLSRAATACSLLVTLGLKRLTSTAF